MDFVPLAEVTRGGQVESIHYGAVAVVDIDGCLQYSAGAPDFLTFTRSTLKPFQALPFLQAGGLERFGFGGPETALLCASHSGEAVHISTVLDMLRAAGCEEHHLRCGCHVPLHFAATGDRPAAGETFTQLHNNCSGKHAGFLAYCVMHDLPLVDYLDVTHPLQVAIRHSLAHVVGLRERDLAMGVDGCSAPNYALPLSRLAYAYARLAQDDNATPDGKTMGRLFEAMTSHPALVSGMGRADLAFMQTSPGNWVAKGGAEAVQAIGIRSAGLGIAIKVADGGARALYPAAVEVLRQLGMLEEPASSPLAAFHRPAVRNLTGVVTGEVRAVVQLKKVPCGRL